MNLCSGGSRDLKRGVQAVVELKYSLRSALLGGFGSIPPEKNFDFRLFEITSGAVLQK